MQSLYFRLSIEKVLHDNLSGSIEQHSLRHSQLTKLSITPIPYHGIKHL